MKRGRKDKRHETSPSPTRLGHSVRIHIPLDLTVEILKKLPTKSLVRFQCVSKSWSSIISSRRDFIDSIVTRSLSQPPQDAHLILKMGSPKYERLLVFSSGTSPQITDKVSPPFIPADMRQHVRGLILCWSYSCNETAIYNPTTRQCFPLPKRESSGSCFFGYDPLMNQYKVLLLPFHCLEKARQVTQVFTLGDPKEKQWRTIQGAGSHDPMPHAVCINGVIYYQARSTDDDYISEYKLIGFDVKSEKFNHVDAPKTLMDYYSLPVNYQGKLGLVCCMKVLKDVEMWVMEDGDLKTQKWSRMFSYERAFVEGRITGATRRGEIILSNGSYVGGMARVLYYDPKRNSMRYVNLIQVTGADSIRTLPDFVENTMRLF